jgi:hypothetical protein
MNYSPNLSQPPWQLGLVRISRGSNVWYTWEGATLYLLCRWWGGAAGVGMVGWCCYLWNQLARKGRIVWPILTQMTWVGTIRVWTHWRLFPCDSGWCWHVTTSTSHNLSYGVWRSFGQLQKWEWHLKKPAWQLQKLSGQQLRSRLAP